MIGTVSLRSGFSQPADMFSVLQGIIWLAIATVAEAPPVASLTFLLCIFVTHPHVIIAGIHHFEFEPYFFPFLLVGYCPEHHF